ncbi:MAG: PAS-domain containing protein [Gemmobacter sp.]|uniref:PAS-domain containing protein n=1 Tax=Gemmobacter sp. TaxID=1898957 RepID=UPI001A40E59F|nr:PAS-domain containing protein [Gemmobacter sp.]MBL8561717.1 PAS-domain containing protein [Gemmobacter sp.]
MLTDWVPSVVLVLTCGLIALGCIFILAALQSSGDRSATTVFADRSGGTTFLFDDEMLLDATPAAKALIAQGGTGSPWLRLLAYLAPRFPDVENRLAVLPEIGRVALTEVQADGSMLAIEAELRGGLTRITLHEAETLPEKGSQDLLTQKALQQEVQQLRAAIARTPMLIWRETASGEVIWANARYLSEAAARLEPGRDLTWPLPQLFDGRMTATHVTQGFTSHRHKLASPNGEGNWYDLTHEEDGSERLFYATPCDLTVRAESALRDFTQTLTKTFAHLPTGLAIFDRQRQLALFNPALLDLCNLPPDFLSARPTLFAFLDAMRDRNMIPEPKDYRSWRKQMSELEKAAASGLYEETWNLPSGQTYRLVGRPHPNGALALMFDDISTEMSRIRRFRADLELGQSVLDAVDQAVAVFSSGGALVLANTSYAGLWGHDPAASVGQGSLKQISAWWRERSSPTLFWAEADTFCSTAANGDMLVGEVRLLDGRLIHCELRGLPGGATLVKFSAADHDKMEGHALPLDRQRKRA